VYIKNPVEEKRPGNDGGCFTAALDAVRRWGGVLEHPLHSAAWVAHGLPKPVGTGWQQVLSGEWMCEVWQAAYGHRADKATGLFYCGDAPRPLDWRLVKGSHGVQKKPGRPGSEIPKRERAATPLAFRDALLDLALGAVNRVAP
jgi:hypothetical protein